MNHGFIYRTWISVGHKNYAGEDIERVLVISLADVGQPAYRPYSDALNLEHILHEPIDLLFKSFKLWQLNRLFYFSWFHILAKGKHHGKDA